MPRQFPQIEDGIPLYELLCGDSDSGHNFVVEPARAPENSPDADAAEIAAAVLAAAKRPTKRRLAAVYTVAHTDPRPIAHELISELKTASPDAEKLRAVGHWLATRSVHVECAGNGLVVLGAAGFGDSEDVAACLGRHPSLTEAAAAAATGAEQPERFLWELAKEAHGEERLACLRGLEGTSSAVIRDWTLREAWPGGGGAETALLVARVGRLDEALARRTDPALLQSTGEMLRVLTGPAADPHLAQLEMASAVVRGYLDNVARRHADVADFLTVAAVQEYLLDGGPRVRDSWPTEDRVEDVRRCSTVLADEAWTPVLTDALTTTAGADFATVAEAAEARGVDTFSPRLARLEAEPTAEAWRKAFRNADTLRARRLAAVAVPMLRRIPEGSPNAAATIWGALPSLLDCLKGHPGIGGDAVLLGLDSIVPTRRLAALATLRAWGREAWPVEAGVRVAEIARDDADPEVQSLASRIAAAPD